MIPYEPQDQFSDVSLWDTSDPVIGGFDGISNIPVKSLSDRTQYLFNRLGRLYGQVNVTGAATITTSDVFKLIKAVVSSNVTLSLDAVGNFKVGSLLVIKAKTVGIKSVRIQPNGSDIIEHGSVAIAGPSTALYIIDGEYIVLMAGDSDGNGTADYWELYDSNIPFDMIGEDEFKRFQPRNTVIANGCLPETSGSLYNRADVARVWQKANAAGNVVSDALWLSDIRYRQFYSNGNGSTTCRFPDMRSMVKKGLDLGRGLSLSRLDNISGGLELDQIKAHSHTEKGPGNIGAHPGGGSGYDRPNGEQTNQTGTTGGSENLIKTAGFIPVIYL